MNNQENLPVKTNNETIIVETNDQESLINVVINCMATESRSDKIALINALDRADQKLMDNIGKTLEVKGIYAETHISRKTGEPVCRVLLIDTEGKSYATGSFVFLNSLKNIVSVLGVPTSEEPLKIQITQVAMEKGNSLKAKVVE